MTSGTGAEDNDDIEATVISEARAVLPQQLEGLASSDSELAEAVTIIRGHPDPQLLGDDRPIAEAATPRQAGKVYAIRIGTHDPIPLDFPAYIGRKPSNPRISGPLIPRLVSVPSPSGEVSSTHVEILQQADTVVVTDLGSTNGTTVTIVGLTPRTLRRGESLVVGEGTLVDIGDGIRIVVVTLPDAAATEGTK